MPIHLKAIWLYQDYGSIKTIKTSGETVIINQDGSVQFEDDQRYLDTREVLGNPVDLYNNLQADASNVSALYDLIHSKDAKEKVKAIFEVYLKNVKIK